MSCTVLGGRNPGCTPYHAGRTRRWVYIQQRDGRTRSSAAVLNLAGVPRFQKSTELTQGSLSTAPSNEVYIPLQARLSSVWVFFCPQSKGFLFIMDK